MPVWPRPLRAVAGDGTSVVPRDLPRSTLFRHTTGCCGALLEYAFERAEQRLFWPFGGVPEAEGEDEEWLPLPLPHLRAKAPGGVREHSTPPERQRCGAVTSNFTRLTVEVGNNEPTPLQLGVDESYVLEVSSEGGSRAPKPP